MSPSNVELLIRAFAGWGRDNPGNMRDILHPDCELSVPDSVPYGGTLQGIDAVIGWFTRELWRWFDEFTSTPEGLIDAGDQIRRSGSRAGPRHERQDDGRAQRLDLRVQRGQARARPRLRRHGGPTRHGRRRHTRLIPAPPEAVVDERDVHALVSGARRLPARVRRRPRRGADIVDRGAQLPGSSALARLRADRTRVRWRLRMVMPTCFCRDWSPHGRRRRDCRRDRPARGDDRHTTPAGAARVRIRHPWRTSPVVGIRSCY
jgi:hypothetical protein